jgi:hypothetical protein
MPPRAISVGAIDRNRLDAPNATENGPSQGLRI